MLHGYKVIVAVTGGIAAYKTCLLVSRLRKDGADVHVIMTRNACEFVSKMTFETLSNNKVTVETFDKNRTFDVEHVALAKNADMLVVAPCTANSLAKIAAGIADDFFSTTVLCVDCPKLLCPAMNTKMLDNAATKQNIEILKSRGFEFLFGGNGFLACGEQGEGRMAEADAIYISIVERLKPKHDLAGKRVLITSGGTKENIDGVRCIANNSSGKMGAEIANECASRGASVTLVKGKGSISPKYNLEQIEVVTTQEMFDTVTSLANNFDYIIMAAAPSDYRLANIISEKIKSDEVTLRLVKNPDIAATVGKNKRDDQKLVVFCAETTDLIENAKIKMRKKNADMVVANDITKAGAGFDVNTNIVSILTSGGQTDYDIMTKRDVARVIMDKLIKI